MSETNTPEERAEIYQRVINHLTGEKKELQSEVARLTAALEYIAKTREDQFGDWYVGDWYVGVARAALSRKGEPPIEGEKALSDRRNK